jgi:hypothetical protein
MFWCFKETSRVELVSEQRSFLSSAFSGKVFAASDFGCIDTQLFAKRFPRPKIGGNYLVNSGLSRRSFLLFVGGAGSTAVFGSVDVSKASTAGVTIRLR